MYAWQCDNAIKPMDISTEDAKTKYVLSWLGLHIYRPCTQANDCTWWQIVDHECVMAYATFKRNASSLYCSRYWGYLTKPSLSDVMSDVCSIVNYCTTSIGNKRNLLFGCHSFEEAMVKIDLEG